MQPQPGGADPEGRVCCGRSNDIKVSARAGEMVIDVFSEHGIGRATIKLTKGTWSQIVLVRFHLEALEGLTLSNKHVTLDLFALSVKAYDETGQLFKSKYLMEERGYDEVRLPRKVCADGINEITIQWVNFYRA